MENKIRVTCIGDSITEWGYPDPYTYYLQELLGKDYLILNCGLSGARMLKNVGDFWESKQFKDALECSPNIVTILLGTNDSQHLAGTLLTKSLYGDNNLT